MRYRQAMRIAVVTLTLFACRMYGEPAQHLARPPEQPRPPPSSVTAMYDDFCPHGLTQRHGHFDNSVQRVDLALNTAAALQIDKRIGSGQENIACRDHENYRVKIAHVLDVRSNCGFMAARPDPCRRRNAIF